MEIPNNYRASFPAHIYQQKVLLNLMF